MTDPNGSEEEFDRLHDELAAKRATLPPGTEPCSLGAWASDKDPKGLNVRAEPSVKGRILARSGYWGLVEAHGVRGWWRALCSNQVTNCS